MKSQKYLQTQNMHLSQKTVPELQAELQRLKEKERVYMKLNKKVKDLQEKSRAIKKTTQNINQEAFENEQIEKLKNESDRTIAETKKIEEDNKLVKSQVKSLQNQLRVLDQSYSNICNENKLKRQRIQLKDEQLVQKQNQLDSLIQKKHSNELVIEELRIDLSKLQSQEQDLRRQLEKIRMERLQEEKQKQNLRDTVEQLQREIEQQQSNCEQYKYKLSQVKEGNQILKEELVTLINLQDKLKIELNKSLEAYHSVVTLQAQSKQKLKLLQDELKVAQEDVRLLTDEYIRENQALKDEQAQNQMLNHEMDMTAKEVFQVWEGVKELMDVSKSKDFKIKAYKVWAQISKILDLE